MADTKVTALTANTTPATTDLLYLVDDPAGTPAGQKITLANMLKVVNELTADGTPDTAADYLLAYDADAGAAKKVLMNLVGGVNGVTPYRIAVSVASNNLTVALKDQYGNDPSASSPVRVQIGDTVREVTAALSVTKNAGTNWFDSGSSELATIEVDYFVYLGYNATDGVVIGFARVPYGTRYDSFSATTTAETYCAISTITNAAAGDAYTVIGRFAATLSAGAGYTWTVPTFTSENLIHSQITETRWLSWSPVRVGYSANPTNTVYQYQLKNDMCFITGRDGTAGTSNATTNTLTLPISALAVTNGVYQFVCAGTNNSANLTTPAYGFASAAFGWDLIYTSIDFSSGTNSWTDSGTKSLRTLTGFYRIK